MFKKNETNSNLLVNEMLGKIQYVDSKSHCIRIEINF